MVLITVRLGAAAAGFADAVFLITVPVLFSLVSLLPLTLRAMRVPGRDVGGLGATGAAARRVRAAAVVPLELELVFDAVVSFRAAPSLVALAFCTMLVRTFVAAAVRPFPVPFKGDPGLAIWDLVGDVGLSRAARRVLDDVGDRTCPARIAVPSVAGFPRILFLGCSAFSILFSLSRINSSL
jgi:hypothetical protein